MVTALMSPLSFFPRDTGRSERRPQHRPWVLRILHCQSPHLILTRTDVNQPDPAWPYLARQSSAGRQPLRAQDPLPKDRASRPSTHS